MTAREIVDGFHISDLEWKEVLIECYEEWLREQGQALPIPN